MSTTVLLVDDHLGFRHEAARLLRDAGFDVIGEAEDAADALQAATQLRPDLILLDIALPDGSGLDLVAPLRNAAPGVRVVLISSRRKSEFGRRIESSAADGFVDKVELGTASPAMLAEMLRP